MYDPSYKSYQQVQNLFRMIVSRMSVEVLMRINNKDYSAEDKARVAEKSTIAYIRPPLTLASVMHMVEDDGAKAIVVAGKDEMEQWNQLFGMPNGRKAIGACLIPVIRMSREHQVLQKKQFPIWYSEEDAVRRCREEGNVAEWLYELLAKVPAFPDKNVCVPGAELIASGRWSEACGKDEMIAKALIESVWSLLNPN